NEQSEDEVEKWSECGDDDSPPRRRCKESAFCRLGFTNRDAFAGRCARRGRVSASAGNSRHELALHLAVPADGEPGNLVRRPTARESRQTGSPAERENLHAHPVDLCGNEMSQLMDKHHEAEADNSKEYGKNHSESLHSR